MVCVCVCELSHLRAKESKTVAVPKIVVLLFRCDPCIQASNIVEVNAQYQAANSASPYCFTKTVSSGQSQLRAGFSIETMQPNW